MADMLMEVDSTYDLSLMKLKLKFLVTIYQLFLLCQCYIL